MAEVTRTPDELQRRADEIYAADRAQDFNHGKDDDADAPDRVPA